MAKKISIISGQLTRAAVQGNEIATECRIRAHCTACQKHIFTSSLLKSLSDDLTLFEGACSRKGHRIDTDERLALQSNPFFKITK